ncbi:hypothetical protein [Cellvibrio mixtus]|uniref:hypothetical protein n=1 Tax=Cellvibrio mixtus TaxID=39650 RepID=UPI0005864BF2|nr:hypothetical protein [Cellvibrio mixtus]
MPGKKESRNGHAFHPIMRKGGVHEKTNKAKRKTDRQQMAKKVNDYLAKNSNKKAAEDSAAIPLLAFPALA